MFRNITQYIAGINDLKIFAMLFSLAFFIGVIIMAYRMSKPAIDKLKNLPFEDEIIENNNIKLEGENNG